MVSGSCRPLFVDQKTCLLAIDALSKYIEVVPSTSVKDTVEALQMIFSRNGLCDVLVSDNASCFTADEFSYFLNNNGIKHITSPPYVPSSNGQAERGVRVLKELLKKYRHLKKECMSVDDKLFSRIFK